MLLLIRAFIPKDIQIIIEGFDFASYLYGFIPWNKIDIYPSFLYNFKFPLINSSLEVVGMQYGSTIANIFSILAWNFLMIVFTLIILLVKFLSKIFWDNMRWSWMIKALNWIFDKLYRMLIFAYFIRNVLELSQFFLISSINEVYENNTTDIYRLISFIFSIIVIFLYISIIGVVLYLVLSSYKLSENKHNKLEEFFRGLKQERKHRLYVAILLWRRLVFVILIITWVLLMSRILAAILTIIQVAYIVLLSFIRPYEGTKGNLIEILNEIYFAFLILFLSIINTESDWSSIKTNFYMWVIVSNTFVVFIIVFGKIWIYYF